MPQIVGFKNGKPVHLLRETAPLHFWTPPRAPLHQTREALQGVGDSGIIKTATGRASMPARNQADLTHLLAEDNVPIRGLTEGWTGSAQVAVEFPEPRARGSGADMTYAVLRESDVPLVPKRRGLRPGGDRDTGRLFSDEDEGASELYMSEEDEDGEADEPQDEDDALARLCQEVGEFVHDGSKGLALVASALRRRRRSALAADGELG